jgi:hypothetical protein
VISNVAGFAASDDAVLTVIQVYPLRIDLITRFPDGRLYMQFSTSLGHYEIEAATNLSSAAAAWAELTIFSPRSARSSSRIHRRICPSVSIELNRCRPELHRAGAHVYAGRGMY